MSDYFFSNGINDNGGNIVLTAPWEHQKSELRCLAIATDKEHQELKVLNGDLILGSNGTYTITYPFETPGLPWAAYLWRETTQNGNPKYENGRIPVEAMLSKLSELSKKADETREFVKRAFMTPEDAEGKMFVPPLEVRKGRLLGFDNSGNPVTGDACPQIAELDEQQKVIEGLAKEANDRALEAANSVILAAEYATNASNSANNAGRSAVSAGNYATNAKNWHDKTASESAATLAKSELAAGRSELAERLARESAARAEQAMNEAVSGLNELGKVVCYVGCAAGRAAEVEKTVTEKTEEIKRLADEFGEHVGDLSAYPTFTDIRTGMQTQSILGYNEQEEKQTGNAIYMNGGNVELVSGGHFIDVPAKPGTVAMLSDIDAKIASVYRYKGSVATESELPTADNIVGDVYNVSETGENFAWDGSKWDSLKGDVEYATTLQLSDEVARAKAAEANKVSLISHVTGTPNNEFDGYGYRGTLRNLGLFGGAVVVSSLGIVTRTGTNQNANVALWARILKVVNGAWVIAAQSKTSRKWNEVSVGSVLEFEMEHVAGVTPPRDDEAIAIVWVNNANAAATASNGALSFRTTSISGGVTGEIPSSPTSGTLMSYSPVFHFKYAPFAGDLSDYAKKTDTVLGEGATASPGATALGYQATAVDAATALGGCATASGMYSEALGHYATASGIASNAFGHSATASGTCAIAVGDEAKAKADSSIALGATAEASGMSSIALGEAQASGSYAIASGRSASASGSYSIALGYSACTSKDSSTALGGFSEAYKGNSTALGYAAAASEAWGTAVGSSATASSGSATALGSYASASGLFSIALGGYAKASSDSAIALGGYAAASGANSVALGDSAAASGPYTIALGCKSIASTSCATAFGYSAKASGYHAAAFGSYATASATYSTAVGYHATNNLSGSLLLCTFSETDAGSLSVRIVAGADPDTSYFDFYHEDQLSGVVTGRRISASNFFSMLDEYGATAEVPDISSGDDYYY